MKIIIAGAGEVGSHLANMLSNEYHDITVIDEDIKRVEDVASSADISVMVGEITKFKTLEAAGVRGANLFIAVSPDESKNIIAATLAKRLGAKKTIARIDNEEYLIPLNKEMFIAMGIDFLFYPEKVAANEVVELLINSRSTEYVTFAGDKLSMIVIKLDSSSQLVDRTLEDVASDSDKPSYRTVAISRNDITIIPKRGEYFREGDTIYVVTASNYINEVMGYSGRTGVDIKNIMIVGGGKIGQKVAMQLQDKVNVKLVDYNSEKAKKLAEILDNTLVINEDGRKTEVMIQEQLDEMDAFIAVTGRSETNILTAMLAKRLGVKRVIAEIENINYISLAESMGVDTIINEKLITASNIFRFTMDTDVQAIKCLNGCDAEVMEFIAKPGSTITKGKISEIDFPRNALIGGVVRGSNVFIGQGSLEIKAYDRVVVFSLPSAIQKVGKFFD
ncbi:MAG: Trk system potassium transporter TrkA [Rikenellaceae bacterium]